MPFRDPILGGNILVRTAMQSENYVAGSTGWRIARDGSVEFNAGTFRGSLTSGTNPGKHVILNNPATGDAVDVYDTSNNLVYAITEDGAAESISHTKNTRATIFDAALQLLGANWYTDLFYQEPTPFLASSQPELAIVVFSGGDSYQLYIQAGSADGTKTPTITGSERNVQGSIMQSTAVQFGNLVNVETYTITTDASGNATFNHNCPFTPKWGFLSSPSIAGADFYEYVWLGSTFGATTASAHFNDKSGNNKVSTTFKAYGLFFM